VRALDDLDDPPPLVLREVEVQLLDRDTQVFGAAFLEPAPLDLLHPTLEHGQPLLAEDLSGGLTAT
jgi:hypothetical protein